jgi:hypothetical protein
MNTGPAQRVIAYDSSKGKALIFDTAYTDDQARAAVKRCVRRKGSFANVRSMEAKDRMRLG